MLSVDLLCAFHYYCICTLQNSIKKILYFPILQMRELAKAEEA